MHEITSALQRVQIGAPSVARNLTVFPLTAEAAADPEYLVLAQALEAGLVSVQEVSASGAVPELRLENRAEQPVLLLDGEQLIGCKQNRVLNLTILAPARTVIVIPVSCVEQGRWSRVSDRFSLSEDFAYSTLRARKAVQVSAAMEAQLGPRSDQGEIWAELSGKAARMGSDSRTGAMAGIFSRRQADRRAYDVAGRCAPKQVGAVFAINGRCVGLELFDAPATCRHYLPKVASGYGLDALDNHTDLFPDANEEAASRFLARLAAAQPARFPAAGLGEDLRLTAPGLGGAGLAVGGRLIHACAFDLPAEARAQEGVAQPSIRRGRGLKAGGSW
jgi:hypothetical protein